MTPHEMGPDEHAVWMTLRQGKAHALPLAVIAAHTGLSRRAAESAMEDLRTLSHEPICANGDGYFEAATVEELDAYIRSFENRCRSMWATRRGLKAARRKMLDERTGQRTMGLVA